MSNTTDKQNGHPIWFLGLGFVMGIALLLDARSNYAIVENFKENGIVTEAEIVKIEFSGEKDSYLYVDYQYVVNANTLLTEHERVYDQLLIADKKIGDYIEAYYLPSNPDQSLLVGNTTAGIRFRGYLGLGLFLFFGSSVFALDIPQKWQRPPIKGLIENGRWLIGTAYLILAYTVVIWLEPLNGEFTIPFVLAFILPILAAMLYCLIVIIDWIGIWIKFKRISSRSNNDVSEKNRKLPESVIAFAQVLTQLGFMPIGEISRSTQPKANRDVTWLYRNKDSTTIAEIGCSPKYVQFYSWYGEVQRIEVSYPHGLRINLPGYQSRFRTDSINAAYRLHKRISQSYRDQLGRAHDLRTVEDVLWWDTIYLQRHYKTVLWLTRRKYQLYIVVGLYMLVFTIIAFQLHSTTSKERLLAYIIAGMFGLFVLNVIPRTVRKRREKWLADIDEDDLAEVQKQKS